MKQRLNFSRPSIWNDLKARSFIYQILILASVAGAIYFLARKVIQELERLHIKSGFAFLSQKAGFQIGSAVPLPAIGFDLATLLGVITSVLLGVLVLRWSARSRSQKLTIRASLVILSIILLVVIPGIILAHAGYEIRFITFSANDSYGMAIVNGMINTLRVSALALVFSTILGIVVAVLRLSKNWLARVLGGIYVELIRNLPLLLHLFFWYFAVLRSLPQARESINFYDMILLNNRGVVLPELDVGPGFGLFIGVILTVLFASACIVERSRRREQEIDLFLLAAITLGILVASIPAIAWLTGKSPLLISTPRFEGFNIRDGLALSPEFVTLLMALSIYHGAYIAEIVRSGIQSVPKGQIEATAALGLSNRDGFWYVTFPQALRIIIPPIISRYLGLIKSSSLAVTVGYSDIISIGNSITSATGQAIEMIGITLGFYLSISLAVSLLLNRYNTKLRRQA